MKITIFTSNQPRHISLITDLARIAERVYAVQECTTVFPGQVADFYDKTEIMQEYFAHVIRAERTVFGTPQFLPENVHSLSLKMGDLNKFSRSELRDALKSDVYVVFGASYIKGELCDFLVRGRALNIHMGLSPWYRGSSCNFWALYDKRPDFVGATIHLLSSGLDSGPMLFHALPSAQEIDAFVLGMLAVKAAHTGLVQGISSGWVFETQAVTQDKTRQIRYSRYSDFTDEVAKDYLENRPSPAEVRKSLEARDIDRFLDPAIH